MSYRERGFRGGNRRDAGDRQVRFALKFGRRRRDRRRRRASSDLEKGAGPGGTKSVARAERAVAKVAKRHEVLRNQGACSRFVASGARAHRHPWSNAAGGSVHAGRAAAAEIDVDQMIRDQPQGRVP